MEATETRDKIDHSMPSDFENEFSNLLCGDDIVIDIKLYRMRKVGTKTKAFYLRTYENDIPTYETIKTEFGGGHYKLFTLHPESEKPVTRQLYIEDYIPPQNNNFDDIRQEMRQYMQQMSQQQQPQNNGLEAVKEMIGLITPIIELTKKAPEQDKPQLLEQMMESFSKGIKKMGDTMINAQIDNIDKKLQLPETTGEVLEEKQPPEPQNNWFGEVKGVLEIVKEMGDSFLNASPVKSKFMKSAIMNSDVMKEAQENEQLADMIYSAGVRDPEIGLEKTNALFKKLGFEIEEASPEAKPIQEKEAA